MASKDLKGFCKQTYHELQGQKRRFRVGRSQGIASQTD